MSIQMAYVRSVHHKEKSEASSLCLTSSRFHGMKRLLPAALIQHAEAKILRISFCLVSESVGIVGN